MIVVPKHRDEAETDMESKIEADGLVSIKNAVHRSETDAINSRDWNRGRSHLYVSTESRIYVFRASSLFI